MNQAPRDDLPLAAEFPRATREQWLKLVENVLKGAPFDKRLVRQTYDGLRIEPLYARDPAARPVAARAPAARWRVMQRVDHPDPAAANAEALHDLENGATGLSLAFAGSTGAHGFGLVPSADALARALDGVVLDAGIAIDLDPGPQAMDRALHLAALVRQRGVTPASADIQFGLDPLGALAAAAGGPARWPDMAPAFAYMIGNLAAHGFRGPFAAADGRLVHDAGGSEAQELAWALASAVAYLRALEAGGIAPDVAQGMIYFRLAADADQFLTIAKFRALRKLWARVEQSCGLAPKPAFIAAETAWRMMTRRDPWMNMLRATIAVFSAGVGGANAITVLPFTAALGLPDRFARRIARNTQLTLLEESNLHRVADPAAGSGGIENLTQQLCAAAWSLFQEIERAGGAWGALEQGLIQKKIATVRAAHEKAVALGKDALTGTSEFPDLKEAPVAVLLPAPSPLAHAREKKTIEVLPCIRLAEPFERLRDASDREFAKTGARPRIFLASLGTPAEFTARAAFAKNFFEAGGIETVMNDGFAFSSPLSAGERSARASAPGEGEQRSKDRNPSPGPSPAAPSRPLSMGEVKTGLAALVAAFKNSGAKIACLCSTDKVYEHEAIAAAMAIAAAGATQLYLAGRPEKMEAQLRAAGIKTFVYAGCDTVATLQAAHDILGMTAR